MNVDNHRTSLPALRFLWCHNPFYLVSVGLMLYGIQILFGQVATFTPELEWQLLAYLCGYTVLLWASAVLIVRLGRVWEDARTILLLVGLLFVAVASSFDRICLDNPQRGARYLFLACLVSIGLSELSWPAMRISFSWRYRGPFYYVLVLLHAYPVWLAHLSSSDQEPRMTWYVLLFPLFASIGLLALMPAAMQGGRDEHPSGTPWNWPWYPWPLFVILTIGLSFRSYALTLAFDKHAGRGTGFALYFLIPILLAFTSVLVEVLRHSSRTAAAKLTLLPIVTLFMAWPSAPTTLPARFTQEILSAHVGSPALVTCCLLALYFAYHWYRGLRVAEWGLLLVLWFSAFVDRSSLSGPNWSNPAIGTWYVLLVLLAYRGVALRSTVRTSAAAAVALMIACHHIGSFISDVERIYFLTHGTTVAAATISTLFDDRSARFIRQQLPSSNGVFGLAVLLLYRTLFADVPYWAHLAVFATTTCLVYFTWYRMPTLGGFYHMVLDTTLLLGVGAQTVYLTGGRGQIREGDLWVAGGLAALSVAVLVSLYKSGTIQEVFGHVVGWHQER